MADKCFITILNGVVNDPSLKKFGEIVIPVSSGSVTISPNKAIQVRANKSVLSMTSGGTGSSVLDIPQGALSSGQTEFYVLEDCDLYIPQYDILRIVFAPTSDIDIRYIGANVERVIISATNSNSLRYNLGVLPKTTFELVAGQYYFRLEEDSYPVLRKIQANYGSMVELDTSVIAAKCPSLQELNALTNESKWSGSFDTLGACKSLSTIKNFYASGTMEGFVAAQRQVYGDRAAKTTGSVALTSCPYISFQGATGVVGSTAKTLSWTETTITFDGTTITA